MPKEEGTPNGNDADTMEASAANSMTKFRVKKPLDLPNDKEN